MYLYFDRYGTLKEQITFNPARVGNSNVNKIFVYWEGVEEFPDWAQELALQTRYLLQNNTQYPSATTFGFSAQPETAELPFDKNQDLKYFKYYKEYKFLTIDIPDEVLSYNGAVKSYIWVLNADKKRILGLGVFAFMVDGDINEVIPDENISLAQWNMISAQLGLLSGSVIDVTCDIATNTLKVYYANGTTAIRNLPPNGAQTTISSDFLREMIFSADTWVQDGENGYYIYFRAETVGYTDNRFFVQLERDGNYNSDYYNKTGSFVLSDNIFKGSDGSVLLYSNEPYSGRLLVVGGKLLSGDSLVTGLTYNDVNSQLSYKTADGITHTIYLGINEKFDKSNVVQTTGDSTDKVMSQKATTDEIATLKGNFNSITNEYIPTNHAVISSDTLIKKDDTVAVTYNSDGSVNFQYPYDLGNPIVIYGLTGIVIGKTYNLSIKLVSGSLREIRVERVNPSTGAQIVSFGTATKDGDIYSLTFTPDTIPSGNIIGISFYFARSLSRDITLTDFSCVESGDNPHTYIDNDALMNIPESSLSYELQQKINSIHIGNFAEVSFIGGSVYTSECTLIKFADGTSLVVDTGTGNRDLIYSEMSRLGITHIDYLFISHYHPDHVANTVYFGQAGLFDSNTTFILPMYITEDMYTRIPENPPYWTIYQPEVLQTAQTYNCAIYRPTTDWEIIKVGGASLEFLNVDHSDWFAMSSTDYNDCSLCAYLTIGNTSIFFSGDIGLPVMNKYKKNMRHCTIFKANHHAEGYDAVPVFLGSISPEIVVTMQGTRMIAKTGTPSIDDQFYYKSTGLQSWCERYHVYNYLTSFNDNAPIGIKMDEAGYCFETKSRASNRFEEGIYEASDPDVPNKNVNYFELS